MNHTRLIDTGDIRLSGKARSISAQLQAIAARATGRVPVPHQSQETGKTTPVSGNTGGHHEEVTRKHSQFKGGDCPSSSPADFQDIDASRDDYRAGISKGVTNERR